MSEVGKYAPRPGSIPGVAINLGGVDLVLAPLALRAVREIQAKGKALQDDSATTEDQMYEFGVEVVHASLVRNYPDITLDEVRELIDTENLKEAQRAVFDQSGLKRVKPGEITPGG